MSTNDPSQPPLILHEQPLLIGEPPARLVPGQKLAGGYCLKQPLPGAGPCEVWIASHPDFQTDLELHFLPESVAADPLAIEEIKRELRKNRRWMDRLSSSPRQSGSARPANVRLHGLVEGGGRVALAMGAAGGETLSQLLGRKGFFECKELTGWVSQICACIDDAHKSDLLHRDLCPENFRVTESGELVVVNFGLSRAINDSLKRSALAGRESSEPKSGFTKADDICGIGVLLYHLLVGCLPLPQGDPKASATAPVSSRRKDLEIDGQRVLPEWEKTIAACLEKNANLRPKNAIEIAMRLGGQRPVQMVATPAGGGDGAGIEGQTHTGAAIRSTVKPGGKPGFEGLEVAGDGGADGEELAAEEAVPLPEKSKSQKAGGRQFHSNVFIPVERPLSEPSKTGPTVIILSACLALLALAGGGYYFFFADGKKASASAEVPIRKVIPSTPVPTPSPEPAVAALQPAAAQGSPAPSPIAVAAATPEATPVAEIAPIPPVKEKVLFEPLHIPEETSPLAKAAAKAPQLIETALRSIEANEQARKAELLLQEKANAELEEAKAAAEKANAELLLKQVAAGQAAKSIADLAAEKDQKLQAIRDAYAEKVRFQAVAGQIEALKKERLEESEEPPAGAVLADPKADPAGMSEEDAPQITVNLSADSPVAVPEASAAQPLTNSLGMKFIPVGDIRVSAWLTRVQDFEAYAQAAGVKPGEWKQPGFGQGPTHPVVKVSWKEAVAFCKWLTQKEHKEGVLPPNLTYRLPTDAEWSQAAGLPFEKGRTAQSRDKDVPSVYPWGNQWPPPVGAGNLTGEETGQEGAIKGYNDAYTWTSPVGSFAANAFGLYDMGGNASQWCLDYWNEEKSARVLRGSSWSDSTQSDALLSSARSQAAPEKAAGNSGFRCVIAPEGLY